MKTLALQANAGMATVRQEQWFVIGNLVAALGAGALASWSSPMLLAILYIDIWLLANPHLIATYTRIAAISARARIYWGLVLVAPIAIAVGLTIVALAYEATGLFALYFVLQAFHVSRQSYGIARRYERQSGATPQRLAYLLIHLFPAWGYLHRSAQAPDSFLGYPIWLPPVPHALVYTTGTVAFGAALGWLLRSRYLERLDSAHRPFQSFILSHLMVSLIGYVWISDITVGWLVVNVWHNIQYLIFVYRQRHAQSKESAPGSGKLLCKALKTPASFFLTCSLCGAIVYAIAHTIGESLLWLGLPTLLIAHFTLNFHHYLADGVVWKSRLASRRGDGAKS